MAVGFVIVGQDSWRCLDYTGSWETLQSAKELGSKAYTLFTTMHNMGLPKVHTVTVDLQKGLLLVNAENGTEHNITVDVFYPDISYRAVLEFVQQIWLADYSKEFAAKVGF